MPPQAHFWGRLHLPPTSPSRLQCSFLFHSKPERCNQCHFLHSGIFQPPFLAGALFILTHSWKHTVLGWPGARWGTRLPMFLPQTSSKNYFLHPPKQGQLLPFPLFTCPHWISCSHDAVITARSISEPCVTLNIPINFKW